LTVYIAKNVKKIIISKKMTENRIPVMVTGIGGGGLGEQILKALRLSTLNYTIIGGDMSAASKGLAEVDIGYILPAANDPDYIPTVLAVCRKHKIEALFAGSEPELKVMSRERKTITDAGVFLPINPQQVIDICTDKFKTVEFLKENNFSYPETVKVTSLSDIEKVSFYPAVLKPSIGGGGSANLMIAQTREELYSFCSFLLSIYPEFIIQEYVGTPDAEYTVGVLVSMDGELINSIALKRSILSALGNRLKIPNRTSRKELGPILAISSGISQGEIDRFPQVTKGCEELATRIDARGAINIQCRLIGDKIYVFEINPRFSGTTSLRAMVGYNEPDILLRRHVLGESIIPHFTYKKGIIVRGLQEFIVRNSDFVEARRLL
jgi:carbamoyl-phosphate synthase large subunit